MEKSNFGKELCMCVFSWSIVSAVQLKGVCFLLFTCDITHVFKVSGVNTYFLITSALPPFNAVYLSPQQHL